MQNRRGFFQSIAGLFVVAATNQLEALSKTPTPAGLAFHREAFSAVAIDLPMPTIPIQSQMQMLVTYMHRELVALLPPFPPVERGHQKMSSIYPHQYGINFSLDPKNLLLLDDEQILERYAMPAMNMIAQEVIAKKATRFAELQLPGGLDAAARVTGDGVSIRGLQAFDCSPAFMDPCFIQRFDVLFG